MLFGIQKDTLYAARFKSWSGGNGLARKYVSRPKECPIALSSHGYFSCSITWKNIVFHNVPFPVSPFRLMYVDLFDYYGFRRFM